DSVVNHYRAILALRKATPELMDGAIEFVGRRSADLLSFVRGSGESRVFCAFNFGGEVRKTTLPAGATVLAGPAVSEGVEIGAKTATLPPRGWLIARLD